MMGNETMSKWSEESHLSSAQQSMNGVHVLTVIDSAKRAVGVDRVWRLFVSDSSLSKHSSELFSVTYL